jgi:hypothetical protein
MLKIIFIVVILFINSTIFSQSIRKPTGEVYGIFTNQLNVGNVFVYRDYYW